MSSLYPAKKRAPETYTTEFDILKASHKFLRSGDDDIAKSWDAQLAKKYEDSLFKEFAVCDLKHYKSGNIALRWRTEEEVLSGVGESTCGNTRCTFYNSPTNATPTSSKITGASPPDVPKLTTMELPFSYVEQGETEGREVMVKVVLCQRCTKKLMWKREREKNKQKEASSHRHEGPSYAETKPDFHAAGSRTKKQANHRDEDRRHKSRKSRNSRSISPHRYPPQYHRIVVPASDSEGKQ